MREPVHYIIEPDHYKTISMLDFFTEVARRDALLYEEDERMAERYWESVNYEAD